MGWGLGFGLGLGLGLHLEQLEEVLARMVGREARVHPQPLARLDGRLGRRDVERRQRSEVGVARGEGGEEQPQRELRGVEDVDGGARLVRVRVRVRARARVRVRFRVRFR